MLYTAVLKDNKDFIAVYNRGRFFASEYSVIYVMPNGRTYNRFGITAGKKVGNAVMRNRAKRLIRLAYRECEIELPIGVDIVIVARTRLSEIPSQEYLEYMRKKAVPEISRLAAKMTEEGKKRGGGFLRRTGRGKRK